VGETVRAEVLWVPAGSWLPGRHLGDRSHHQGHNPSRCWVLDADPARAFDQIDHSHLLNSIGTFPASHRDQVVDRFDGSVADVGAVPGGDLVLPLDDRPPERPGLGPVVLSWKSLARSSSRSSALVKRRRHSDTGDRVRWPAMIERLILDAELESANLTT
jgi:hypothetical protein